MQKRKPRIFVAPLTFVTAGLIAISGTNTATHASGPELPQPALANLALSDFDTSNLSPIARTANSDTFDAGDGIRVTELTPSRSNFRNKDGEWVDISTQVSANADGTIDVLQNPLHPKFANSADDTGVMKVSNGGYTLGFTLLGGESSSRALPVASSGVDNEVIYPDAVAGADLAFEVGPTWVKETIVLDDAPAADETTWRWIVRAPGLALQTDEFGDLRFVKPDGSAAFVIPAPVMWDSSGVDELREPAEYPVATSTEKISSGVWRVDLAADHGWLADSDRVYPVFVDPTASLGDSNVTSYKSDGATRTDFAHIGNSRDSNTDKYWRARIRYDYSSLYGKEILGAHIDATVSAGTTTARTGSVNTALSSCSEYACVDDRLAYLSIDSAGSIPSPNTVFTNQIRAWVRAKSPHSLIIRGAETSGAYTYKQLNTALKISWQEYDAPTVSAPTTGMTSGTTFQLAPTLFAPVAGPDGNSLQVRYIWDDDQDAATPPLHTTSWMSSSATGATIPASASSTEGGYFWKAEVRDLVSGKTGVSDEFYAEKITPDPGDIPTEIIDVLNAATNSPNSVLVNNFEWLADTQTVAINYVGDLATVQTWLTPLFAGIPVEYRANTFSQAEIDQAFNQLYETGWFAEAEASPNSDFSAITLTTTPAVASASDATPGSPIEFNEVPEESIAGPESVQIINDDGIVKSIPISYDLSILPEPAAEERWNDQSSFSGGVSGT